MAENTAIATHHSEGDVGTKPEDASEAQSSQVPSYARPIIASRLPEYSNAAAEQIRAAFQSNTYKTIQALGMAPNLDVAPFRAGTGTCTTFSDFAYECSPFDIALETRVRERQEHEERMRHIAAVDFAPTNPVVGKLKHEDYAFEYMSEPFDGEREHNRQQRFLHESKCLSKPFIPAGVEKPLERPTRILLGDVMASLYKQIVADWPEAQPTVLSTAEDLIVVYFKSDRVKNPKGVLTYMNNVLRRNDAVLQYDLRKVSEGWDIMTEDFHMMYTLRPPWVKAQKFLPAENNKALSSVPTPEI